MNFISKIYKETVDKNVETVQNICYKLSKKIL